MTSTAHQTSGINDLDESRDIEADKRMKTLQYDATKRDLKCTSEEPILD